jgi:hypothetical protein
VAACAVLAAAACATSGRKLTAVWMPLPRGAAAPPLLRSCAGGHRDALCERRATGDRRRAASGRALATIQMPRCLFRRYTRGCARRWVPSTGAPGASRGVSDPPPARVSLLTGGIGPPLRAFFCSQGVSDPPARVFFAHGGYRTPSATSGNAAWGERALDERHRSATRQRRLRCVRGAIHHATEHRSPATSLHHDACARCTAAARMLTHHGASG